MSKTTRGRALIINIERFNGPDALDLTRDGSSMDVKNLKFMLAQFGFELAPVKENLDAQVIYCTGLDANFLFIAKLITDRTCSQFMLCVFLESYLHAILSFIEKNNLVPETNPIREMHFIEKLDECFLLLCPY